MQTKNDRDQSLALKKLISMSLLVALAIIAKRFLGYNDKIISVSFGFVPIAISGMLFGPLGGVVTAAIVDIIGGLRFPTGTLHPGFTLAATITGLLYGLFLHTQPLSRMRIVLCQVLITVLVNLTLNTLLLVPIVGRGFMAILPLRILKNALFFPVEVFVLTKMNQYRRNFERLVQ